MVRVLSWQRCIRCISALLFVLICFGCIGRVQVPTDEAGVLRLSSKGTKTLTPFQPLVQTATSTVTPSPTSPPYAVLWVDGSVPTKLKEQIIFSGESRQGESIEESNTLLVPSSNDSMSLGATHWVYAVVAPFPTVIDSVSLDEIKQTWRGEGNFAFGGKALMMAQDTKTAFETIWGNAADQGVTVVNRAELLEKAWAERPAWAIIPFEDLEPSWKILRVDEMSPIDQTFNIDTYPLAISFQLIAKEGALVGGNNVMIPSTNREPDKMTSLVLTGVTALVRAIANKMERNGMTYPAQDIKDWLLNADLTHISNEVSFDPSCPYPNPLQSDTTFCSSPKYIELLDYIDADIIELTGNHELDWGREAFEQTLKMYQEHEMSYFAGGMNLEEARRPLLIENHGNKLAFIGCNYPGPPYVWATSSLSGNAACEDYDWIKDEIRRLHDDGYLVIVTLQHTEFYSLSTTPKQRSDFLSLIDAGADIVSGSQAHYPNPFAFEDGKFVHYGLGNLFFDQMDAFNVPGVQREFIDRHIFYNGQHISTEILTAHLEDFARPRPMTAEERASFLSEAFAASGW